MFLRSSHWKFAAGLGLFALFVSAPLGSAQDRDRYGDRDRSSWDQDRGMYTRLDPGTTIPVRTNQPIDVERSDNRVYYGIVDRDVRGDNGRIAIPRGANAELMVRVAPDNDLILDLESVVVNGQRYAIRSDPNRVESQRDNSLVGAIVGAVSGGEVRGRAVRIPRDSVVTFRLDRPLVLGVQDRGVDRDGNHYHDWYGDRDRDRDRDHR
jgi:hypothetical protein